MTSLPMRPPAIASICRACTRRFFFMKSRNLVQPRIFCGVFSWIYIGGGGTLTRIWEDRLVRNGFGLASLFSSWGALFSISCLGLTLIGAFFACSIEAACASLAVSHTSSYQRWECSTVNAENNLVISEIKEKEKRKRLINESRFS